MKSFLVAAFFVLSTCNAFLSSAHEIPEDTAEVLIIPMNQPAPSAAKKIGTIAIGNNSTKIHCNYAADMIDARQKAKQMGGNVVKITALTVPSFISSCYKIIADVMYDANLKAYEEENKAYAAYKHDELSASEGYALLYLYYPDDNTYYSGYNVKLDDNTICRMIEGAKDVVKVPAKGKITLSAKTESKVSIEIEPHSGEKYYIKCGKEQGTFIAIPVFRLMDKKTGAIEFDKMNAKAKHLEPDKSAEKSYLFQFH